MSEDLSKLLDEWKKAVESADPNPEPKRTGTNVTLITYVPRWKWFKPPMWRIFRWAYKVHEITKYTNVYPVAINSNGPKEVEVSGVIQYHQNEKVNKLADRLKKKYYDMEDKNT